MGLITGIVIHCSDSEFGCANVIRDWHVSRGWRDIGYNFVVQNGYPTASHLQHEAYMAVLDGAVENGRTVDANHTLERYEVGAHARGLNATHVGICLIGVARFSRKQFAALTELVVDLAGQHGLTPKDVIGHYESPNADGKTCPNFDMGWFRGEIRAAAPRLE